MAGLGNKTARSAKSGKLESGRIQSLKPSWEAVTHLNHKCVLGARRPKRTQCLRTHVMLLARRNHRPSVAAPSADRLEKGRAAIGGRGRGDERPERTGRKNLRCEVRECVVLRASTTTAALLQSRGPQRPTLGGGQRGIVSLCCRLLGQRRVSRGRWRRLQ